MVLPRHKLRGLSLLNVALVAVVVAVAVAAYLLFFRDESEAAGTTRPSVAVARGEVVASVSSSGTLQSSQSAAPQFATSGTVTAVYVKVGQVVAKNAALAKIDPAPAERQVRIAEQNQIAAANSVDAASESLDDAEQVADDAEEATATPTTGQGQTQNPEVAVTNAKVGTGSGQGRQGTSRPEPRGGAGLRSRRPPCGRRSSGTITALNGSVGSVDGWGQLELEFCWRFGRWYRQHDDFNLYLRVRRSRRSESAAGGRRVPRGGRGEDQGQAVGDRHAQRRSRDHADGDAGVGLADADDHQRRRSYSATFSLAKFPAGTRIGQTANVAVRTAKASNALYVPSTAVVTSGTTARRDAGRRDQSRGAVGVQGGSFTEIKSGLDEGEQVELLQGAIGATGAGQGRTGQFPGRSGGRARWLRRRSRRTGCGSEPWPLTP